MRITVSFPRSFSVLASLTMWLGAVEAFAAPPAAEVAPSPPSSPPGPPSAFSVRPISVEGHLGLGTPVGGLGVMGEYLFVPAFSLSAGVGLGSGTEDSPGVHGAVMARLRPFVGENDALVLGAGLSTGSYNRYIFDGPRTVSANWAHFAQFDAGWEHRADSGFLVRLTAGAAVLLNNHDLMCKGTDSYETFECTIFGQGDSGVEVLPVLDFALGQSF